MKITINPLDTESINKAYQEIINYHKKLKEKETTFLKRLGEIGVNVASIEFDTTIQLANAEIHARLEPVRVNKEVTGNRLVITATGKDVIFIEFGAGINYGNGYPTTQASGSSGRPNGIVGIGEYGAGQGKNPKGWWYTGTDGKGHHSYGNQPAMAMYEAEKQIIEQITHIAREVFK